MYYVYQYIICKDVVNNLYYLKLFLICNTEYGHGIIQWQNYNNSCYKIIYNIKLLKFHVEDRQTKEFNSSSTLETLEQNHHPSSPVHCRGRWWFCSRKKRTQLWHLYPPNWSPSLCHCLKTMWFEYCALVVQCTGNSIACQWPYM